MKIIVLKNVYMFISMVFVNKYCDQLSCVHLFEFVLTTNVHLSRGSLLVGV